MERSLALVPQDVLVDRKGKRRASTTQTPQKQDLNTLMLQGDLESLQLAEQCNHAKYQEEYAAQQRRKKFKKHLDERAVQVSENLDEQLSVQPSQGSIRLYDASSAEVARRKVMDPAGLPDVPKIKRAPLAGKLHAPLSKDEHSKWRCRVCGSLKCNEVFCPVNTLNVEGPVPYQQYRLVKGQTPVPDMKRCGQASCVACVHPSCPGIPALPKSEFCAACRRGNSMWNIVECARRPPCPVSTPAVAKSGYTSTRKRQRGVREPARTEDAARVPAWMDFYPSNSEASGDAHTCQLSAAQLALLQLEPQHKDVLLAVQDLAESCLEQNSGHAAEILGCMGPEDLLDIHKELQQFLKSKIQKMVEDAQQGIDQEVDDENAANEVDSDENGDVVREFAWFSSSSPSCKSTSSSSDDGEGEDRMLASVARMVEEIHRALPQDTHAAGATGDEDVKVVKDPCSSSSARVRADPHSERDGHSKERRKSKHRKKSKHKGGSPSERRKGKRRAGEA